MNRSFTPLGIIFIVLIIGALAFKISALLNKDKIHKANFKSPYLLNNDTKTIKFQVYQEDTKYWIGCNYAKNNSSALNKCKNIFKNLENKINTI